MYGICSMPEHRPEAAWRRVGELCLTPGVPAAGASAAGTCASAAGTCAGAADPCMPRPVWLLAEPVPLAGEDLPQLHRGSLILEAGPERIESGWWDGKGVARDYYSARRAQGVRWWIFQERRTKGWYLHGVFA